MKQMVLTLLLLASLLSITSYSQTEDVWTAFEDQHAGLFGFKDSNGNIKIEPKYMGYMLAKKVSDIVAVMEDNNDSYYLLRDGRKVGTDSLYIFDMGFDCESEGFIRFRDRQKDKVGIFSSEGKVAIPAEYDEITKIRNGLAVGLKGAVKKYPDNDSSDEHWSWTGGTEYLIDPENNILVNDFINTTLLDFHSLKIEDAPSEDPCRESFSGINCSYYTFNNNEKLFREWLDNNFLKNLNQKIIIDNSYPEIIYWKEQDGWTSKKSSEFIKDNFDLIKERISELNKENSDYFISIEDFIPTPEGKEKEFEKYLDNCGDLKTTQFPLMNVVISHNSDTDFYQDHFGFLKIENGFKLLLVTVRNGLLK